VRGNSKKVRKRASKNQKNDNLQTLHHNRQRGPHSCGGKWEEVGKNSRTQQKKRKGRRNRGVVTGKKIKKLGQMAPRSVGAKLREA